MTISMCGLDEAGVDAFLDDAEVRDAGTARYPWPKEFRDKLKTALDGMTNMDAVKRKINAAVLDDLGPGLFNRGPFVLPVEV